VSKSPADGVFSEIMMKRIGEYGFGICLIILFISFGYMMYQFFGGISLIFTTFFLGLTIAALNVYTQEITKKAEESVHSRYEKIDHH
jgi:cyanate permease